MHRMRYHRKMHGFAGRWTVRFGIIAVKAGKRETKKKI